MVKNIGIIGYGSMGKMLLDKFIESKTIQESNIFISNRTFEKIINLNKTYSKLNICKNNIDVVKNAKILFICVKPLEIKNVLTEIVEYLGSNVHIISLNGSVLFNQIEKICINHKISKIIPSIIAEVNQSVTLVCHNANVNIKDKEAINNLLKCFGTIMEIPEPEMGMGSELTSCMPGFIGAIFKVITEEAVKHTSISKEKIIDMVIATMYGTGKLLLEKEMTYDTLINRVATKRGITEEGTKIIENKLPEIIEEMFIKTLEKRRITTEKANNEFNI
ncbi:pyrroline-5-carboxylate reductase 3 [Spirochaetia bacterium]|nr:pyrroline-5-carboxylate reductase 3 [Spirochaetia bacterium]GHU30989.1 pyrroline-5-carboxylate reductase 3 [Spirochaetia bacterium]